MPYKVPTVEPKWFPEFEAGLPSMEGKVVLITGTTSGTGSVAAHTCAKKGATVVCLNRPSERAKAAMEKLKGEFPDGNISMIEIDLMSFEAVRKCASEIKSKFEMVDVLCCNAGVMALDDKATEDGYDVQMQTNHLSHWLLIQQIFPLIEAAEKAKGEARIVMHSSGARNHPGTPLKAKYFQKRGGNLGGNRSFILFGARWERYHQTKLANAVFTTALHKKLQEKGSKIMSLCAHPGLAATDLQATTSKSGGMGSRFTTWFMGYSQSKEDGTMGILRCMCDPNVISGTLYGPKGFTGPAVVNGFGKLTNEGAEKILWKESVDACGELF